MMMTCRLLCALLVLALCCCPSVCAAESTENTEAEDREAEAEGNGTSLVHSLSQSKPEDEDIGKAAISPSLVPEGPRKEIGNSGSLGNGSGADLGITAVAGPAPTAAGPESGDVSNTLQNHDTDGNPGPEISTRQSAEGANQEAEDPAEKTTTTTTTYAPTTITTTTTKAPTTNTEAPTTTTTRAPSRLREIDGSLSSFAWVCARLLLAASALAYTTVG
ncbi:putative mucin TcMUCII [Trypanosoma cruzi]|uniref:Mucin TcMUCII, putative n=2 Tax=Trypanosoma cruzi TaxID=5693 RepID=Q4E208_TRYCC|nr:mucin TcMUCII, putative [Trypanosoma cruzi]EAN98807.1 mucin TcMUCII, putative [Trypanosoma cruzi]PWV15242.1 putative mucin TcMUCII [Trypanosoma cruzi]RNC39027.1 mucin TcMUCII [Trypanosoma cruzi]|eukprot:XP_820658.1 mucin TcMUCII [Trypanosoma cruzi strain CL Brener]